MPRERILVVDDEAEIRALCSRALSREGFQVSTARDGADALSRARREPFQLAIIDVIMPGMSGVELCQRLRANPDLATLPILFLTARDDIADKAAGFAVGADDYLTKPFDIRELVMRSRALLRRASSPAEQSRALELTVGELRLDRRTFTVSTPESTVLLTQVEFRLLEYLMSHPGQIHPTRRLLQAVWGYPPGVGSGDVVRRHIKNIRDKIERVPSAPGYLRTVGRLGYTVGE